MANDQFDGIPDPLDAIPAPLGLPRFRAWKQYWTDPNLGLSDYLFQEGNLELVIALCEYLWPRIYVVNGCYLRIPLAADNAHVPSATATLQEQQQFESLSNHLHMYDLFTHSDLNMPLEAYEYVAKVMLKTWEAALRDQYPDVQFAFDYQTEPDSYGPTISFWHR